MKKKKIIYYKDELNEDFKEIGLPRPPLVENYKFKRDNPINNFFSDFLFFAIAKPLFYVFNFFCGVRYHNVKSLKKYRNEGLFIYQNHTTFFDMFTVQACVIKGKRTNIIGYSDTTSIPVVKHLARALGYIPLPDSLNNTKRFMDSLDYYIKDEKQNVLIFPEAHIWPYYTKIRPFRNASFHYPAKLNSGVLPVVTTFRKRKFFKKPGLDIRVGEVIYPKRDLSVKENKEYLRDECYKQMCELASSVEQYEFITYIKKE